LVEADGEGLLAAEMRDRPEIGGRPRHERGIPPPPGDDDRLLEMALRLLDPPLLEGDAAQQVGGLSPRQAPVRGPVPQGHGPPARLIQVAAASQRPDRAELLPVRHGAPHAATWAAAPTVRRNTS